MDSIYLADNEIVKFNLNILKLRSFTTLKFILSIVETTGLRVVIYHSMKIILIEYLLEEKYISKNDAWIKCREYILYEYFDYKIFNDFFYKLKEYAETGKNFANIADAEEEIRSNKIFWPDNKSSQQALRTKMINFEVNYKKKKQILPKDIVVSSEMRLKIAKVLSEKKVLEKLGAISIYKKHLQKDFDINLFEENWRYFQNVFSSKKS